MEAGFLALLIAMSIGFTILGIVIEKIRSKRRPKEESQGILNVNCNDPEDGPYLFLELTVPLEDVIGKKSITFDVNVMEFPSHE